MAQEKRAMTIAEVWNNFQPSKSLAPQSSFRVERKDVTTGRPLRALGRASSYEKWFLIGHRGCGKSTYLSYLLDQDEVKEKFYPVRYSIQEVADLNDLDYQDVLFTIASKLIDTAQDAEAIQPALQRNLENWGRTLVEEINKAEKASVEVEGGLKAFFVGFAGKLQTQHSTRRQFRRVVEPKVSDLISNINQVTEALEQKLKKPPLIAIDDLDKATVAAAKKLFDDYFVSLTKPSCHIVYTAPVSLMHESSWTNLQHQAWYLPNIKLHERGQRNTKNEEGYRLMHEFVEKRMSLDLITKEALKTIITYGGGVFRQTCMLMQNAADHTEDKGREKIDTTEAQAAIAEVSNGLLSQLTTEDLNTLKRVAEDNSTQLAFESAKLLHNLSLLRYRNDHDWHDVNPVLWERVDGYHPQDAH